MLPCGRRAGRRILGGLDRVVPAQRPEKKRPVKLSGLVARAVQGPEREAVLGSAHHLDEGPRSRGGDRAVFFDPKIERPQHPREFILAEAILDRAGHGEQRPIRRLRRTGLPRKPENPQIKGLRLVRRRGCSLRLRSGSGDEIQDGPLVRVTVRPVDENGIEHGGFLRQAVGVRGPDEERANARSRPAVDRGFLENQRPGAFP